MVPKLKGREKIGSLQQFQAHLGSSDDFGPSCFNPEDCHRIMILDIRMLNQDRHAGQSGLMHAVSILYDLVP